MLPLFSGLPKIFTVLQNLKLSLQTQFLHMYILILSLASCLPPDILFDVFYANLYKIWHGNANIIQCMSPYQFHPNAYQALFASLQLEKLPVQASASVLNTNLANVFKIHKLKGVCGITFDFYGLLVMSSMWFSNWRIVGPQTTQQKGLT